MTVLRPSHQGGTMVGFRHIREVRWLVCLRHTRGGVIGLPSAFPPHLGGAMIGFPPPIPLHRGSVMVGLCPPHQGGVVIELPPPHQGGALLDCLRSGVSVL